MTRKKRRKTVQIFVKVDGSRVTPMEVSLSDDKVEDVMRRVQKDEDVYVMMQGKVLRTSEKLKNCGVTDGCTIQVTSRMRGGGRHKVKKRKESAKTEKTEHRLDQEDDGVESVAMDSVQPMEERPEQVWAEEVKSDKSPAIRECDKDAVIRMTEQNQVYRKFIEGLSAVSDFEAEWMTQEYLRQCREIMGWTQEQAEMMECGIRWAVEARRKCRETARKPTTATESLVRGEMRGVRRTRPVEKGKGNAMEEKENTEKREAMEAKELSARRMRGSENSDGERNLWRRRERRAQTSRR